MNTTGPTAAVPDAADEQPGELPGEEADSVPVESAPACPWLFADDAPAEHEYEQHAPTQQYLEYLARLKAMAGLKPASAVIVETPVDELAAMRRRNLRPVN
jgi:hypothetical protein